MEMNKEVKIDPEMFKKAHEVASKRVGCKSENVKTKWEYNWFGKPEEHHFIGALGELCFASSYYGIALIDESLSPSGDHQDFKSKDNKWTIDVKTSTWWDDDVHLKVTKREFKKKPKDIYVLVQYIKKQKRAVVAGYATRHDIAQADVQNYGYEDVYSIPAKQLREPYYS